MSLPHQLLHRRAQLLKITCIVRNNSCTCGRSEKCLIGIITVTQTGIIFLRDYCYHPSMLIILSVVFICMSVHVETFDYLSWQLHVMLIFSQVYNTLAQPPSPSPPPPALYRGGRAPYSDRFCDQWSTWMARLRRKGFIFSCRLDGLHEEVT